MDNRPGNPFATGERADRMLIAIVLCLLVAAAALLVIIRGGGLGGGEKRTFPIGPRCGPLPAGNQIEDQLKDEGACRNQCRAACSANGASYDGSSLRIDAVTGCNICDCSCG